MKKPGVKAYNQMALQAGVNEASPHRLIQMLIDAALHRIATAKGFLANKQIARKGEQIGMAISIIDGLRASLDKSQGEIAQNLDVLYEFMIRRLTEANISNDLAILDEVAALLKPIKQAWDSIPEEVKQQHAQATQQRDGEQKAVAG